MNHERSTRRLSLSVAGLGHDLDGAPRFLEPAPATEAMSLPESELVLRARQRRELVLEGAIPQGERALYAAVIAEFEPLEKQDVAVEVTSRVASLFLLRGPRPWKRTVEVIDVGVLPGRNNAPLPIYAAVRNTGNVHIEPAGGKVEIRQHGRLLDIVRLPQEVIIPGFARRLVGSWDPPDDLTGRVQLTGYTRFPRGRATAWVDFTQGSPDRPSAQIENLVASGASGAHVELIVVNAGNIPIAPEVVLEASRGGFAAGSEVFEQPLLAVGQARKITWEPALDAGTYLITARAVVGEKLLDEAITGLEVGGAGALRWIALGALGLAIALLLLVVRARRTTVQ